MALDQRDTWTVVLITAALAFCVRAGFLARPSLARRLPAAGRQILQLVPPAALASFVVPAMMSPSQGTVAWSAIFALAAAGLAAWRWSQSGITICVGIGAIIMLHTVLGLN